MISASFHYLTRQLEEWPFICNNVRYRSCGMKKGELARDGINSLILSFDKKNPSYYSLKGKKSYFKF